LATEEEEERQKVSLKKKREEEPEKGGGREDAPCSCLLVLEEKRSLKGAKEGERKTVGENW